MQHGILDSSVSYSLNKSFPALDAHKIALALKLLQSSKEGGTQAIYTWCGLKEAMNWKRLGCLCFWNPVSETDNISVQR